MKPIGKPTTLLKQDISPYCLIRSMSMPEANIGQIRGQISYSSSCCSSWPCFQDRACVISDAWAKLSCRRRVRRWDGMDCENSTVRSNASSAGSTRPHTTEWGCYVEVPSANICTRAQSLHYQLEQRGKGMEQLATLFLELEKYPLEKAGAGDWRPWRNFRRNYWLGRCQRPGLSPSSSAIPVTDTHRWPWRYINASPVSNHRALHQLWIIQIYSMLRNGRIWPILGEPPRNRSHTGHDTRIRLCCPTQTHQNITTTSPSRNFWLRRNVWVSSWPLSQAIRKVHIHQPLRTTNHELEMERVHESGTSDSGSGYIQ